MKTFLKILLAILVVAVAVKLLPLLMIPVVLGLVAFGLIALLLTGGVAFIASVGVGLLGALFALTVTLAAILSPIWVPILAVIGLISLIRRNRRARA